MPNAITHTITASLDGYRSAIADLGQSFRNLEDQQFLADCPATKFILSWMRDLKHFHRDFGALFNRRKRPPIADDFTGAVAIALNEFLKSRGHLDNVRCEEKTHKHKNATRPDVSVRNDSEILLATIECKTSFGWNRDGWQIDHESRSDALNELCPECTSYLCVMTQKNWDSTELENSTKFGREWLCLCNENVGKLPAEITSDFILTPIEPMFIETLGKLER